MRNERTRKEDPLMHALRAGPPRVRSSRGFPERIEHAWRAAARQGGGMSDEDGAKAGGLANLLAPACALAAVVLVAALLAFMFEPPSTTASGNAPAALASKAAATTDRVIPDPEARRRAPAIHRLPAVSLASVGSDFYEPYREESKLLADDAMRVLRGMAASIVSEDTLDRAEADAVLRWRRQAEG